MEVIASESFSTWRLDVLFENSELCPKKVKDCDLLLCQY